MKEFMSLAAYIKQEMSKAYNSADINEVPAVNDYATASNELPKVDPKTWNAKIIKNEKYLMFNNHYLNITKLRDEIAKLYSAKGYENYGFAKLGEAELVRYKTVRNIISDEFLRSDGDDELDPAAIALVLFNSENKDFDWQPEPLTI